MKKTLACLLLLAGCANEPIVDMRGVDQAQYEKDLAECETYAAQVHTGGEAAKHAAVGAVVGGAIGAIIGDSQTAERGAGVGGLTGATKGASKAEQRKEQVVFNCLRGRGYKVLG